MLGERPFSCIGKEYQRNFSQNKIKLDSKKIVPETECSKQKPVNSKHRRSKAWEKENKSSNIRAKNLSSKNMSRWVENILKLDHKIMKIKIITKILENIHIVGH